MTTKNLGDGGFKWFVGVVEDRNDPEYLGRVRVRVYNCMATKWRLQQILYRGHLS